MKSHEARIKALEQKLSPQLNSLVITYIIDEKKEYRVVDETFVRPVNISHKDFVREIISNYSVIGNIVLIGTVRPSEDGKR